MRDWRRQPVTMREKLQALDRATLEEERQVGSGRRAAGDITLQALNAIRLDLEALLPPEQRPKP